MFATLKLILPALVPSWRFFETVQPSPRVQWRFTDDIAQPDWREFRPRPQHLPIWRMLVRMVWNPDWNELLYSVSLAERLTMAPTDHAEDALFRLVSGRIALDNRHRPFQFRLVFVDRDAETQTFISGSRTGKARRP